MGTGRKKTPEFFEDSQFDPVKVAIGPTGTDRRDKSKDDTKGQSRDARSGSQAQAIKKKAGFYLSVEVLERFTRKFHELKLSGVLIENKSALVEAALSFALDDIDLGEESRVLKRLNSESAHR